MFSGPLSLRAYVPEIKFNTFNNNKQHRGTQQVKKRFPSREKSPILRLEMLIEVTFRPFVLTHRNYSGRISRA